MKNNSTQKSILTSTLFVGGSQFIKLILNLFRNKIISAYLGPSGFGLLGSYSSIMQLVQSVFLLGSDVSIVRKISSEYKIEDERSFSKLVSISKRLIFILGTIGLIITIITADKISYFTFQTNEFSLHIKILSVIIFLNIIHLGNYAILQGRQKIKEIAKLPVYGALAGTLFSVPLIYLFNSKAIILILAVTSLSQLFASVLGLKKLTVINVNISISEFLTISKNIIRFGFPIMLGGGITGLGAYLSNTIIIRNLNITALGYYQASFSLSSIYIGIILNAMGKDFYPRISANISEPREINYLVQQQVRIGLILALPGIFLTLAISPYLITILYSSEFIIANEVLKWMMVGIFIRVIVWPVGYVILANGDSMIYFLTQLLFNITYLSLLYFITLFYDVTLTGIVFLISYLVHFLVMVVISRYKYNLEFDKNLLFYVLFIIVFTIINILISYKYIITSIIIFVISGIISAIYAFTFINKTLNIKKSKIFHKIKNLTR